MRVRWFVLAFVLVVLFPGPVAGFCQDTAQALISGADVLVDAPGGDPNG